MSARNGIYAAIDAVRPEHQTALAHLLADIASSAYPGDAIAAARAAIAELRQLEADTFTEEDTKP